MTFFQISFFERLFYIQRFFEPWKTSNRVSLRVMDKLHFSDWVALIILVFRVINWFDFMGDIKCLRLYTQSPIQVGFKLIYSNYKLLISNPILVSVFHRGFITFLCNSCIWDRMNFVRWHLIFILKKFHSFM